MRMDISDMPVYIRPGVTDGRKGLPGLVGMVKEKMGQDISEGTLLCSVPGGATRSSVLCYDGTGFWYIQKRLAGYRFPWPKDGREDFLLLLEGVDCFGRFEEWDSMTIG